MKNIILILLLKIVMGCTEADKSAAETAQIVVESFYQKDLPTLEKYTTRESFNSFLTIQENIPADDKDSNFSVLQEEENEEIAWVKFTTSYENQPETFKLVKENGIWKVADIEMGEKGPF